VILLLEKTKWGDSNLKAIEKASQSGGVKIHKVVRFDWGEKEFRELKPKSKGDSIIFVGNAPEAIALIRSLKERKISNRIISHWGILGGQFFDKVGHVLDRSQLEVLVSDLPFRGADSHRKEFFSKVKSANDIRSDANLPSAFGIVHAYDVTKMWNKAMLQTGEFNREKNLEHFKKLKSYQGPFLGFRKPFSGKLNEALGPEIIGFATFKENGELRLLK